MNQRELLWELCSTIKASVEEPDELTQKHGAMVFIDGYLIVEVERHYENLKKTFAEKEKK